MRIQLIAIVLASSLAGGCLGASPDSRMESEPKVEAEALRLSPKQADLVMGVLSEYMNALNDLDIERHVATYHFPHYRHASGAIAVWQNPNEAMPLFDVPIEKRRAVLRGGLEPDWHRSEWTKRDIVQASDEKVHVATQFVRLREDGSLIKTFDSLYVLTIQDGRWGIKGRSSFAP